MISLESPIQKESVPNKHGSMPDGLNQAFIFAISK